MIENRLRRKGGLLLAIMVIAIATSKTAAAGDEAAAAEVLFGEGKKLVAEGNYAAACPKFEESQKLDPGMGTLYRLGDCYEHVGRIASAWAAFVEVAASTKTAGQQARADDAKKRASELEPQLPKLVVKVAQPSTPGLVVKRGDVVIGAAQWGTPIPVDPGETTLAAEAPDRVTWQGKVTIALRATAEVEVPALALAPKAAPVTAVRAEPEKPFGAQRTLAVVSGVAGVIGLGVGGAFGFVSMSKGDDAEAHCDAANTCDAQGLELRRDALSAGDIATVGFIAGGVLLAAATVLWITAPSRTPSKTGALPPWQRSLSSRSSGLSFAMELP